MAKSDLYEEARSAGFDLPDYEDITTSELKALLQEKPESKSKVLMNLQSNPVYMSGMTIAPNGECELTDKQLGNKQLMSRVEHGVKTGVYSWK